MDTIWKGSDNLVKWEDFTNLVTGAKIDAGTCVTKLYDDNEVGGPTQLGTDITHSPIGGGTGDWYGVIPDTHADLEVGMTVRYELTANGGAGLLCLKKKLAVVKEIES